MSDRNVILVAIRILFLWFGAFLVTIALDYGAGVTLGWWGFAFWAGIGVLAATWSMDTK